MSFEYDYHRKFTMLCPKCQRTDKFRVTVSWEDHDKVSHVSLARTCPDCKVSMYDADDLLIPALKELNAAGFVTRYHCAVLHDDGYFAPGEIDWMPSKEFVNIRGNGRWIEGPYIILTGIQPREEELLRSCISFQADNIDAAVDYRNSDLPPRPEVLPLSAERITQKSNVLIVGVVRELTMEDIRTANIQLCNVIHDWIQSLQKRDMVHVDHFHKFDRMANDSWSSHRAIDDLRLTENPNAPAETDIED